MVRRSAGPLPFVVLAFRQPILQEVVELLWVRVQSLGLEIVNFFIGDVNLEADDISVLNFALGEGVLRLHKLNHPRFDFLGRDDKLACHVGENASSITS